MKPITNLLAAGLLLIACSAFGQALTTNFTPASIPSTPIGNGVSIQLRVTNFTKISSLQLPITYNSAILRFDSIDFPIMPGYGDTTLASHPTAGKVVVTWFPNPSQYPQGVTYAANTALFTLRFTVIGAGTATVNVGTAAPGIEVINSTGNTVSVSYQSGGSTVVGGGGGGGGNNTGCTGTGNPPAAPTYTGFKVIANQIYIPQGQYGCMPVTVNGFSNILTLLFAMHWDPTVLQYDCTRAHNLPDLASKINNTAPNTLVVGWDDPSASGVTRADGAKIFEVCFRAIGAPGAQTVITMNGTGLPSGAGFSAEAYNSASQNVWVATTEVKDTVFAFDPANPGCAVTFTADKDTVDMGAQTCVDVKASKFFWMTNTEFTLTYDATKLSYQSINLGSNPLSLNTSGANSNFTTASGSIKFNWANTTATTGLTIPDNTSIFSVCFNATAAPGTTTNINFGSSSCSGIGVSRKNIGGVPIITNAGNVTTRMVTTSVNASATNPNCSTGTASLTATATGGTPVSYSWAGPGGFTSNLQNPTGVTTSGTYSVTVTFTSGPAASTNTPVVIPAPITIPAAQATVVAVSCFGGNNGSISINPTGGTAPYTYQWAGPNSFAAQTKDINNLLAGNYVVTVTDSKGCSLSSNAFPVNAPQPLTVLTGSIVTNNVKCFGGGDGSINISTAITGGTAGYSVAWGGPNGYTANGTAITGLLAGNYIPTITDSRGCTNIAQPITVGAPQAISINVGAVDDVKCKGSTDGCITLNVSGGTPSYSFNWVKVGGGGTPQAVQSPCGLAAGNYLVTVTDNNACTKAIINNITIAEPATALVMTPTTTPASCAGVNDGSITLNASGGWPGTQIISYSNGPVPLPGISPVTGVPAGTYTAKVTDAKGCAITQQVTVGGAPAMTFPTPSVTNVQCFGDANGCISITPSGGSGAPYTITWTNTTLSGATICGLNPGTYTPTIKDNAGCSQIFNAITVSGPIAAITLNATTTQSPNGSIDLSVSGGTGTGYTYKWNGPGVVDATTQDLSGLATGTYTVEVRDENGCVKTGSYTVQPSNLLIGSNFMGATNACNNDGCIFVKVPDQAVAPFVVQWTGAIGSNLEFGHSFSICNLAPGNYNVTVTSQGNPSQTIVLDTTITQLQPAVVGSNKQDPNGASMNGSISLTPVYPSTYSWSTGATTPNLSSLDSGTYTVTITNISSHCTAVQTFYLERYYPDLAVTIESLKHPTCGTLKNGEVHLSVSGGVPPLTYAWSGPNGVIVGQTSKDLINQGAGTYTCTITQGNGDTSTHTSTLTAQSTLAITNVSELSACNGYQVCGANSCDGKASVSFSGQSGVASILWSNGITTVLNETLCGGAYSVTVTDGLGCTSVWSDALTAPSEITSSSAILEKPSCHGDCDGVAQVQIGGGVAPYVVKWSTGQNDQIAVSGGISKAVGVCGGDYTVTITDNNNISRTVQFTVADPDPITLDYTIIVPNSFNSCDGQIVADLNGATLPATVTWSGSFGHTGDGQRAENLCAGELVSFIITDANGCSAIGSDTIPYPKDGCLQVRPVLTPGQQDGNNDFLLISCIETVENSIEIYNRWGQLVFETKAYDNLSNNWKGTTKSGQPLAEGAYFYILNYVDVKGNTKQQKGYINLLR